MTTLHVRTLLAVAAATALTLNAGAQTSATAPAEATSQARPGSAEVQAARKAVAKAVAVLVKDLSSNNSAKREAAQRALANLSESVMAEVVAQSKLTDAEHVARAGELFATLIASARQGQMLLSLPTDQRKLLAAFALAEPKLFNSAFDENAVAAAKAMPQLAESNNPAASILMAWAIRCRPWEVRLAALKAAGEVEKPHPALADALYAQMLKTMPRLDAAVETMATIRDRIEQEEHYDAVVTLVAMKDGRILPRLLDVLMNNEMLNNADGADVNVVDMIRQLKDKRTIVTLMDIVKDNTEITTLNYDKNKKVTVLKGDIALLVILLQTGQKVTDFGFFVPPDLDDSEAIMQLGFEKSAQRKEARKKLRAWWDANKKDYKDVEKVHFGKEADHNEREDAAPFVEKMK